MGIRLWPKDFERKEHITKEERYLLRNAARNFKGGYFAVGIDPVGRSSEKVKMGLYLSPNEGLVTFSIYPDPIEEELIKGYVEYVRAVEGEIYERLLDSKMLIVRKGQYKTLKFPYKHIIMFCNESYPDIKCPAANLKELSPYATAKFFTPFDAKVKYLSELKIFGNIRMPFDPGFEAVTEQEAIAVFERLASEYVVIMNEKENCEIVEKQEIAPDKSLRINGNEMEYKTFLLDEYQVALVNEMGKGHRVILANPGAGKSVLLLSKAFKYASLYKKSKVLLTCYNSNLADSYVQKHRCANFGSNRNLYIMTLHKLVKSLYTECLHMNCESNIASQEEIDRCILYIKQGKISIRFKAIFIDEVQIFEPSYLELCYALLEKTEDAVFLMAGDLNQTVREQSRRGDAPWKKIGSVSLDFTGRVRYIERNYRNSRQIGQYLNRMLLNMNQKMAMLDMINFKEFEYNSFEMGDTRSLVLKIKTGLPRFRIKDAVLSAIQELVQIYQLKYSDIAVLFPYKENKPLNYRFLYWITDSLDEQGIPCSLITSSNGSHQKKRFSEINGIVLSTIDSALGLDFKAVILAGLYPYNYVLDEYEYVEIGSWSSIRRMPKNQQEKVKIQMRKLYTACSRARDALYVLSDLAVGSPLEEILMESGEENDE